MLEVVGKLAATGDLDTLSDDDIEALALDALDYFITRRLTAIGARKDRKIAFLNLIDFQSTKPQ